MVTVSPDTAGGPSVMSPPSAAGVSPPPFAAPSSSSSPQAASAITVAARISAPRPKAMLRRLMSRSCCFATAVDVGYKVSGQQSSASLP